MSEALRTDLLVTWLAAAGALGLLGHVLSTPNRRLLENRSIVILAALALLSAVRGFQWLYPAERWLRSVSLACASVLPVAFALFTEGLLRRHLPLWTKLLASLTAAGFFALAIVPHSLNPEVLAVAFAIALLAVMLCLAGFQLTRDAHRLSLAENDMALAFVVVTVLAIPLAASDFRTLTGFPPNRVGGIAVLAFVYVLARIGLGRNRPRRILWDAAWRVLQAVVLTAALVVFAGDGGAVRWFHAFSVALALVLTVEIWERVTQHVVIGDDRALVNWLAKVQVSSLAAFLESLRLYSLTEQHMLLRSDDVPGYSPAMLREAFDGTHICSLAQLRYTRTTATGAKLDAAEQMVDLFERHEMTHACLLYGDPIHLLLINLPEPAGARDAELELQIIQRCGSLAAAAELSRA